MENMVIDNNDNPEGREHLAEALLTQACIFGNWVQLQFPLWQCDHEKLAQHLLEVYRDSGSLASEDDSALPPSSSGFQPQGHIMAPEGCWSSSHHICVPGRKVVERKMTKWTHAVLFSGRLLSSSTRKLIFVSHGPPQLLWEMYYFNLAHCCLE